MTSDELRAPSKATPSDIGTALPGCGPTSRVLARIPPMLSRRMFTSCARCSGGLNPVLRSTNERR
jgi:hypothetical protein